MTVTLLSSLLLGLSPHPALLPQEGEAPEIRFVEHNGIPALQWGEHVVLRDLALRDGEQSFGFDPARVRIVRESDGIRIEAVERADRKLSFEGTFALDYEPEVMRQRAEGGAPIQFVVGRMASELCDTLVARESGLALVAPGCLSLDFWLEGGPAEIRFRLRERPLLRLSIAPSSEDGCLPDLREKYRALYAAAEQPLPADLEQLFFRPLPQEMTRHSLAPQRKINLAEPNLINLRLGPLPDQAAFDVVVLENPTEQTLAMPVDFAALGWEQPRRQRAVVDNADGALLGLHSERFETKVPPRSRRILTFRPLMPKGLMASADGPLAPIFHNWTWTGSSATPSSKVDFLSWWTSRDIGPEAGWTVFSVADGREAPFRVESATDEQGRKLVQTQQGPLLRVERQASELELRRLELHFLGRVKD